MSSISRERLSRRRRRRMAMIDGVSDSNPSDSDSSERSEKVAVENTDATRIVNVALDRYARGVGGTDIRFPPPISSSEAVSGLPAMSAATTHDASRTIAAAARSRSVKGTAESEVVAMKMNSKSTSEEDAAEQNKTNCNLSFKEIICFGSNGKTSSGYTALSDTHGSKGAEFAEPEVEKDKAAIETNEESSKKGGINLCRVPGCSKQSQGLPKDFMRASNFTQENAGVDLGIDDEGQREEEERSCYNCHTANEPKRKRCSFCRGWKGGKRSLEQRNLSNDSTQSEDVVAPGEQEIRTNRFEPDQQQLACETADVSMGDDEAMDNNDDGVSTGDEAAEQNGTRRKRTSKDANSLNSNGVTVVDSLELDPPQDGATGMAVIGDTDSIARAAKRTKILDFAEASEPSTKIVSRSHQNGEKSDDDNNDGGDDDDSFSDVPSTPPSDPRPGRLCAIPGCPKFSQGTPTNFMCQRHFKDPGAPISYETPEKKAKAGSGSRSFRLCATSGCPKASQGTRKNFMCKRHFKDPSAPVIQETPKKKAKAGGKFNKSSSAKKAKKRCAPEKGTAAPVMKRCRGSSISPTIAIPSLSNSLPRRKRTPSARAMCWMVGRQDESAIATMTHQSASPASVTRQKGHGDVWRRRREAAVPAPDIGEGWMMAEIKRPKGSPVALDKYWWSPDGKRFRSRPEVERFLKSSIDGRIAGSLSHHTSKAASNGLDGNEESSQNDQTSHSSENIDIEGQNLSYQQQGNTVVIAASARKESSMPMSSASSRPSRRASKAAANRINGLACKPKSKEDMTSQALAYTAPFWKADIPRFNSPVMTGLSAEIIHAMLEDNDIDNERTLATIIRSLSGSDFDSKKPRHRSIFCHLFRNFYGEIDVLENRSGKNLPLSRRERDIIVYCIAEKKDAGFCRRFLPYRESAEGHIERLYNLIEEKGFHKNQGHVAHVRKSVGEIVHLEEGQGIMNLAKKKSACIRGEGGDQATSRVAISSHFTVVGRRGEASSETTEAVETVATGPRSSGRVPDDTRLRKVNNSRANFVAGDHTSSRVASHLKGASAVAEGLPGGGVSSHCNEYANELYQKHALATQNVHLLQQQVQQQQQQQQIQQQMMMMMQVITAAPSSNRHPRPAPFNAVSLPAPPLAVLNNMAHATVAAPSVAPHPQPPTLHTRASNATLDDRKGEASSEAVETAATGPRSSGDDDARLGEVNNPRAKFVTSDHNRITAHLEGASAVAEGLPGGVVSSHHNEYTNELYQKHALAIQNVPFDILEEIYIKRKRLKSTIDLTDEETRDKTVEPDVSSPVLRNQIMQQHILVAVKKEKEASLNELRQAQITLSGMGVELETAKANFEAAKKAHADLRLNLEQMKECVICQDADKCVALFPCAHLSLCAGCKILDNKCPVCRANVKKRRKINVA